MSDYRPPKLTLSRGPYQDNNEHLRDELSRIDLLVRAQVLRWRLTIAASKPEDMWGMVHVSDAEVKTYLQSEPQPLEDIPESVADDLRPFWKAAEDAFDRIHSALQSTPYDVDLRLRELRAVFDLSDAEYDVVLLCLLAECDYRYRRLFGYLQDDASRPLPPVELVVQILRPSAQTAEEGRALFEPASPLLRHRIVLLSSNELTRSMQTIRLDDRIASWLLCQDDVDRRLQGIVSESSSLILWKDLLVEPSLQDKLHELARFLRDGRGGRDASVLFHGPEGSGRWESAQAICSANDTPLLRVNVEDALRDPTRWEFIVDLTYREAALRGCALYWADADRLFQEEQSAFRWEYLLRVAAEARGPSFLAIRSGSEASGHFRSAHILRIDFPIPDYELRKKIWSASLTAEDAASVPANTADLLASSFQLTEGQIRESVTTAHTLAKNRDFTKPKITPDDLYEACRRQSGKRLISFARRLEPRPGLTLDDVILPEANKLQLRELRNRIALRNRLFSEMGLDHMTLGRGLLALFLGPSGAGKTWSAELIASEQRMDLYKVDLSAVVSKWVGETEKHLNRIFNDAEDSNAMLFFDECDALFGARGEIKEAKDRWANSEVNFLLQRVEEYTGVVIMATNLRQNLDEAFMRRIQVVVNFPMPDATQRLGIWRRTLPRPPLCAVTDEELVGVAHRFSVSGGMIRNIVIDAAYRALATKPAEITLRMLLDSIAREYEKANRPITQGEFGKTFLDWVTEDILAPTAAN